MPSLQQALQAIPGRLSSVLPDVAVDRERVAAVAQTGFDAFDTWSAARPYLIVGGAVGAAVSAYMLYRRRKHAEAYPTYLTTLALSLGALWAAYPMIFAGTPPPAADAAAGGSFLGWVDDRRARYAARDPQWATKTLRRVQTLPGVAQMPAVRALLG